MQNCKIAVVIPTAYPTGGVQTWLDYVVPGVEAAGYTVTVLGVNGHFHDAKKYFAQHPFSDVRLVVNPTGSREGRVRSLICTLKSLRPELVLSVNIIDVYEAVARMRQKGMEGMRVAMALHGFNGEFFHDIKIFNKTLDGVISTNRLGLAAAAAIGGIEKNRIYYASCGVSVGEFQESRLIDLPLTLLYSGRFDQREKRILDLPEILKALEARKIPFRLKLAGTGPDESSLRAALSCFGSRVEFLGQLDEQNLRSEFYQPGAILLITSPSESGPLVAWEAMAGGVAVVTSNYLGIGLEGSLHNEKNCMVFSVSDSEAAADAIARLQSLDLRKRLIRQGYELVKQRYDRAASIAAWQRAFRKILEQPPRPSSAFRVERQISGRLDRYFGASFAETLRRFFQVEFRHRDPGGEWPHSYSTQRDTGLVETLRALDLKQI